MSKYQQEDFINLLKQKRFNSEEEMEIHLEKVLPEYLGVARDLVVRQHFSIGFDGQHSKRPDIVVNNVKGEVLVVFEIKRNYYLATNEKDKTAAKNQLRKYCQETHSNYGVLISERYCCIMQVHPDGAEKQISALPSINTIQPGIHIDFEEIVKKEENSFERQLQEKRIKHEEIDNYKMVEKKKILDQQIAEANAKTKEMVARASKEISEENERKTHLSKKRIRQFFYVCIIAVVLFFSAMWYFQEKTRCDIKGNISASGEKIYHTKNSPSYDKVVVEPSKGEKIFCSEKEAADAGYKKYSVPFTGTQESNKQTNTVNTEGPYSVNKVVDGDTINVEINKVNESIRLIGIDSAELQNGGQTARCFANEASQKMKELVSGKQIYLEADKSQDDRDKYGRLLRYVWVDKKNINKTMVEQGFAKEYTYKIPYKYQSEFKSAQANSSKSGLGLWSVNNCNGKF